MSRPKLLRDIIVIVTAKVILVVAAGMFVFGPADRPQIDVASVASRLIASPAPNSPPRNATP